MTRLYLDAVREMIADGNSMAQIGTKFDRSCNVIRKFLHKNEEDQQAYLTALQERGYHQTSMIEGLVLKVENGEMSPDVAQVAIDGRKWIASRFHPNLLFEKLIGKITHHQNCIPEQHWAALKSIVENWKRQMKVEVKAKQTEDIQNHQYQVLDPLNIHRGVVYAPDAIFL